MWQCPHCEFCICEVLPESDIVICKNCGIESPLPSSLESVSVRVVDQTTPGAAREERAGSRYKRRSKLVGACANSKKRKRENEKEVEDEAQEQDVEPELESYPTGEFIESRQVRCQHTKRHLANLVKNAQRLSAECGWSCSIVACPPEKNTYSAKPLEILLQDKNGRKPPTNSKRNLDPEHPKPMMIERGTQFYKSVSTNFERELTPSKTRANAVREMFSADSYISPLSTSVLSVRISEMESALRDLPEPQLDISDDLDTMIMTHEPQQTPPVTGGFITPFNSNKSPVYNITEHCAPQNNPPPSTAPEFSATQSIAPEGTNQQSTAPQSVAPECTAPLTTAPEYTSPQSAALQYTPPGYTSEENREYDMSSITPSKSSMTATTTTTSPSISLLTGVVPDTVTGEPGLFFARKSLVLENSNTKPRSREVLFPQCNPITILGGQTKKPQITVQAVRTRLPAVSCTVCGVEMKSKVDKAYRFDEKGRNRGAGKIPNQWARCQEILASTSSGIGGRCGSTAY